MTHRRTNLIIASISIFLFIYIVIRACVLSFTIDEAYTFLYFTRDSYYNIINFSHLIPNNSVVNSILTKWSFSLFPLSEFTLRLHSVIAIVIYLYFSWSILKNIDNNLLKVSAFIVLNMNPYVLDFFSMSRGHAISWSFVMMSLYYFKIYFEKPEKKLFNMSLSLFISSLAVLASFSILDYYFALLCILIPSFWINRLKYIVEFNKNKTINVISLILVIFSFIITAYSVYILFILRQSNLLVAGAPTGFLMETVLTVIEESAYFMPYAHIYNIISFGAINLIFIILLSYWIYSLIIKKIKTSKNVFFYAIFLLLMLIIIIIQAQHYLLGINYMQNRAAIYIWIIFIISGSFGIYLISKQKRYVAAILYVAAIFTMIHFILTFNFNVTNYRLASSDKEMMIDLGQLHQKDNRAGAMNVAIPEYYYEYSAAFYKIYLKYNWLNIINYKLDNPGCDYATLSKADYYYLSNDKTNLLKGLNYKIIKRYSRSNTILVKNLKHRN